MLLIIAIQNIYVQVNDLGIVESNFIPYRYCTIQKYLGIMDLLEKQFIGST